MLVQTRDAAAMPEMRIVTRRQPTDTERADMAFAWVVARHVKSNAIVYAKDGQTAGIGAGQMNRRDSARIAAAKAREAADAAGWAQPLTVGSARSPRTRFSPSLTACSQRPKRVRPR